MSTINTTPTPKGLSKDHKSFNKLGTAALGAALLLTPACSNNSENSTEKSNNDSNIIEAVEQKSEQTLEQYIDYLNTRVTELDHKIQIEEPKVKEEMLRQDREGRSEDEPNPEFYYSDSYHNSKIEKEEIKAGLDFYNELKSHLGQPVWIIKTNTEGIGIMYITNHIYYSEQDFKIGEKEISDLIIRNQQDRTAFINNSDEENDSLRFGEYGIKETRKLEHLSLENICDLLKDESKSENYTSNTKKIFGELASKLASKVEDSTYHLTQDDYDKLMDR